ncbi:tetraacyldisaccharide 4'-kinase [Rhizobium sp. C4]|uniref:tetraacyldisaccharide 4'-kinase n=1 Tax=Rhizobium sp. C4 TaxID=1349800 RepID=UPI001E5C45F4|nr:tetraacyldisaccharide 4'-kinase [Rhizobium sp. C4]MCD2172884.1 tetraacyldisaccharide 4'-kinase [Rhizobium sp. C4]
MVSESPPFWWTKIGWQAALLWPASLIYGAISGRNMRRARRAPVDCPVICVGNFTVGGAGKTPTAIAIARAATALGYKPGLLSRGYSGLISRPTIVDPDHHRAVDVGDEPLLLARAGLTVVARNRLEGARKLIAEGADLIIMDDGFQSARIAIDYALVVVDGKRGIGNGLVVPSGPIRAPLKEQLRHVTTLLAVSGGPAADPFIRRMARAGKQVLEATVAPVNGRDFNGKKLFAFAGIADPTKFYGSLADVGAEVVATRSFPDHHHFADDELRSLVVDAERDGLTLVTTAKDRVRLSGHHGAADALLERINVLEIEMMFDDPGAPGLIVEQAFANFRKRKFAVSKPK